MRLSLRLSESGRKIIGITEIMTPFTAGVEADKT